MFSFSSITQQLLEGFGSTILLFFLTLVFALPLGLIISFGSMSHFKPLRWLVRGFVWIIRGTPLMLQIIVIFYGPGLVSDFVWPTLSTSNETINTLFSSRLIAALVAFVINYACYRYVCNGLSGCICEKKFDFVRICFCDLFCRNIL